MNRVPIIHVAGTKGKGSTCGFLESILRHHGFKTALYTSPHLVTVRERIRINGKPITEDNFINKFSHVYKVLENLQTKEYDMPTYFKFMTVLMFHIIVTADIDVAILEVGIGGELDCTNIIEKPTCVGITKLELDHMQLLGNDLSSIAWQKAGIFKNHVPAFTVNQRQEAIDVLYKRSIEKKCDLTIVNVDKLKILNNYPPKLGIDSLVQFENAALAVQLAETFINKYNDSNNNIVNFDKNIVELALKNTQCPGRSQIIHGKYLDVYLDGAHTQESMKNCVNWFNKSLINYKTINNNINVKKILIFNSTGSRDYCELFNILKTINFNYVYFVPNNSGAKSHDHENKNFGVDEQLKKCHLHMDHWTYSPAFINQSITQAFENIINIQINNNNNNDKIMVLITGSLHLVGASLAILDENLVTNKHNIIDI